MLSTTKIIWIDNVSCCIGELIGRMSYTEFVLLTQKRNILSMFLFWLKDSMKATENWASIVFWYIL